MTLDSSELNMFNSIKFEHLLNIDSMLLTFLVLKLLIFSEVKALHSLNI